MIDDDYLKALALLTIRLIAGILFFFQAYDKIFKIGMKNVASSLLHSSMGFSQPVLRFLIALSSLAEFAGSLLLIAGLFIPFAVTMLAINMIGVAFAFSMVRPMWDMQYYFPRLILLLLILLLPAEWDRWSLDMLLRR